MQQHLKNHLNYQKIAASVLITKLEDATVIDSLQEVIQRQRDAICQHAEALGLNHRDFFPNGDDEFTFSTLDRLMLNEIAKIVKTNGLQKFLRPAKLQPKQGTHTSQPGAYEYRKESQDLRKRLQGRYESR